MKFEKYTKIDAIHELLEDVGVPLTGDTFRRIDAHLGLIQSLGNTFGVVSAGDIERGGHIHVVDSLSLVPYLSRCKGDGRKIVDIGSGGGFPGLVCAAVFPDSETVLIERSVKKCAFLRRCVAELGLESVSVLDAPFDDYPWSGTPVIGLVRGLERASDTILELVGGMAVGSTCLWLTGPKVDVEFDSRFHVEQIVDGWSALGLRRGALFSVDVVASNKLEKQ